MSDEKPQMERQAEVDAAWLVLVLARAQELGLWKRGRPDVSRCNEIIDEGERHHIRARVEALGNPKLLVEIANLRNPIKLPPKMQSAIDVTITFKRAERGEMGDFASLWAVTEESRRQRLPDIAVCEEGIVVRVDGAYFLIPPAHIYAAVAEAFGIPLERPKTPKPAKTPFDPDGTDSSDWGQRYR
jgi:hypothetical protein